MFSTTGYEWRSEMKSCNSLVLRSREYPIVFIPQRLWTTGSTQCFAIFHFWLSLKTFHNFITITNMVSMERGLNKLFNDTNCDKENLIIKEIWSIKLEFPNFFFWGVYKQATRGPVTSSFQWTRQWGWSALPKGATATASRFEPGTSQLRVHGLKSTEPQQFLKVCENVPNLSMDTQEMKYYFWWGKKKNPMISICSLWAALMEWGWGGGDRVRHWHEVRVLPYNHPVSCQKKSFTLGILAKTFLGNGLGCES